MFQREKLRLRILQGLPSHSALSHLRCLQPFVQSEGQRLPPCSQRQHKTSPATPARELQLLTIHYNPGSKQQAVSQQAEAFLPAGSISPAGLNAHSSRKQARTQRHNNQRLSELRKRFRKSSRMPLLGPYGCCLLSCLLLIWATALWAALGTAAGDGSELCRGLKGLSLLLLRLR